MGISIVEIGFHRDEHELVSAAMNRLESRGDGKGWINLQPHLSDEQEAQIPHQTALGSWFSGRGPVVSMATWTPSAGGRKPRAAQIGLAHGTGQKALDRLAEVGLGLPEGWVRRQDHAKHGIVVDLPSGEDPGRVISWLIVTATFLRTVVEPGAEWVARVHEPDA